jgi:hypothetical protein
MSAGERNLRVGVKADPYRRFAHESARRYRI